MPRKGAKQLDIYCPRCGEPWDVYSLNHDMSAEEAQRLKAGQGCPCCHGREIEHRPDRAVVAGALMSVLGDDLDGLAATLEDFGT